MDSSYLTKVKWGGIYRSACVYKLGTRRSDGARMVYVGVDRVRQGDHNRGWKVLTDVVKRDQAAVEAWWAAKMAQASPAAASVPATEPVVPEQQRRQERVEELVNAGVDAILGPITPEPQPTSTRGGARKGAGRKPVGENVKGVSVSLPAEMVAALKAFGGGNLSAGIREMYRLMVEEGAA